MTRRQLKNVIISFQRAMTKKSSSVFLGKNRRVAASSDTNLSDATELDTDPDVNDLQHFVVIFSSGLHLR